MATRDSEGRTLTDEDLDAQAFDSSGCCQEAIPDFPPAIELDERIPRMVLEISERTIPLALSVGKLVEHQDEHQ